MHLSHRGVFQTYGINLAPYEREIGAAIGVDPKAGTPVLVIAVPADLFQPDGSVVDNVRNPRWNGWADTPAGVAFDATLKDAMERQLPVHAYIRIEGSPNQYFYTRHRDARSLLVGRVTQWDGERYRIDFARA
ncbi:hypothetical protein M3A49_26755 [Paraburkholderia sp. CNPSo 3076]|uniref:hypothetical protein n=1 Tax=Paraburkholderia sp. CNPSo 3076 TaxID=2940936 RepID=UPI0022571CF3|nr:hypothetical protein [Paraburkholderia sp. CNPSo 3076]MCX5543046.1 hypothetical protein [Paraburkholderia sp. CNPSo 3076]